MKPVLLCLHGWGADHSAFDELRDALKGTDVEILTPDLPGFGDEPEPPAAWTVSDYVAWVEDYIERTTNNEQRKNFHILGHSFGGRIAIKLAAKYGDGPSAFDLRHVYLCAAAGIRRPRHIKRIIGLTLAKTGKLFLSIPGIRALRPIGKKLLYKLVRVHDYEKASQRMRETMIRVTQEDLRPFIKRISIPTDIFWGKKDGMTPYADALYMEKHIEGSTLHTFKDATHRVHRTEATSIAEIIRTTTS